MTELVITRGLPGSGKSTFAEAWVREDKDTRVRVNRDDLRKNLFNLYWGLDYAQEKAVTVAQQAAVEALLKAGKSVVVDDTNLRLRNARAWCDMAVTLGVEFEVVDIDTDVETCVERDRQRFVETHGARQVGGEVIRDMAQRFPFPLPAITPSERTTEQGPAWYVPDEGRPEAYIVDIDGTIAQMVDRGPHEYHRVGEDAAKWDVLRVIEHLVEDYSIVLLSGRKDSCREQTEDWLANHGIHYDELFMRDADDNRKDFIVKAELFDKHVRYDYWVRGVFDDRQQVVDTWRAMGLTCFQVAPGQF